MAYELDVKDRKILYELDLDSRQSYKEIGKKVGLSKEVVNYRISKMEESGIIKGYYTLINMSRLGNVCNRFFVKFRNLTPEKENEIISFFVNDPKYWWVDSCDGFADFATGTWEKDIIDCYKRREEFFNKYKPYLQKVEHSIYAGFYIYKRAYLVNKTIKDTKPISYISNVKIEIDDIDEKILQTISTNARMPTIEIAKAIKTTPAIVKYRLKKLQDNKVIEAYRVMIDLSKIGYYWYKIEFTLKDYSHKKEMLDFFSMHPNIVYAYETTGESDIEIELEVESYEKFRQIFAEIKSKFKDIIEGSRHLIWYKEHKIMFAVNPSH